MATTVKTQVSTHDKLLRAKEASARVAQLSTGQKNAVLLAMADAVENNAAGILQANSVDLEISGLAGPLYDRLLLTPERIAGMAEGVRDVAKLADPVGECIGAVAAAEWIADSPRTCAAGCGRDHL